MVSARRVLMPFRKVLTVASLTVAFGLLANADIAGSSSGTFANPLGDSGLVDSGVGTNTFTWGDPDGFGVGANSVSFAGNAAVASPFNTPFKVGTLTYFNGTTTLGTNATSVDLNAELDLTSPVVTSVTFPFTLAITTTPNTGSAADNADILSLTNLYTSQNFVVGADTYTLLLLGFENVDITQGFVDAAGFHVYEGATGTADLEAEIVLASQVPEPLSVTLLLTIAGGLFVAKRRRA
jgi:hypothetical protein